MGAEQPLTPQQWDSLYKTALGTLEHTVTAEEILYIIDLIRTRHPDNKFLTDRADAVERMLDAGMFVVKGPS